MNEWIKVEESLPTEYLQEVLCLLASGEICLCCYNTISNIWTYNCSCNIHEDDCECRMKFTENKREVKNEVNVSRWMPLPETPHVPRLKPGNPGEVMIIDENGDQKWIKQD